MFNAMLWILRTGAPWRDLPPHYGPWKSVYTRYSRWTKQGVWQAALDEIAKEFNDDAWMIDATIIRAHQDSAGVKGGAPKPSVLHAVV
jgi:transposase